MRIQGSGWDGIRWLHEQQDLILHEMRSRKILAFLIKNALNNGDKVGLRYYKDESRKNMLIEFTWNRVDYYVNQYELRKLTLNEFGPVLLFIGTAKRLRIINNGQEYSDVDHQFIIAQGILNDDVDTVQSVMAAWDENIAALVGAEDIPFGLS